MIKDKFGYYMLLFMMMLPSIVCIVLATFLFYLIFSINILDRLPTPILYNLIILIVFMVGLGWIYMVFTRFPMGFYLKNNALVLISFIGEHNVDKIVRCKSKNIWTNTNNYKLTTKVGVFWLNAHYFTNITELEKKIN